jgi:uncharacterized membrane protein (DUF106 family)
MSRPTNMQITQQLAEELSKRLDAEKLEQLNQELQEAINACIKRLCRQTTSNVWNQKT